MTPGLALIIGVLIGAAVLYFVMQAKAQKRERALQQTRARLAQVEQEQEQRLSDVAHQLEADYEQQLSTKIEQYQDEYEQHLEDLEAEYEARLAALGIFDASGEPSDTSEASTVNSEGKDDNLENVSPSPQETDDQAKSSDVGLTATAAGIGVVATAAAIVPDPWEEQPEAAPTEATDSSSITDDPTDSSHPESPAEDAPSNSATSESNPENAVSGSSTPDGSEAPSTQTSKQHQDIEAIQSLLQHNRRALTKALPSLTKLSKDPDPTVRLGVINTLKQTESIKAIPLLRQALRDSDNEVVAAANEALVRFKGIKSPTSKPTTKKLPKNR